MQALRSARALAAALVSVAVLSPAAAQDPKAPALSQVQPRLAPPTLLTAFDVMAGTVQDLTFDRQQNGDCIVQVVLGDAVEHLVLHPHDVRAPGFRLLVDDGTAVTQVPTPPSVTWRGLVLERPDAVVAATIVNGGLTAQISSPTSTWAVQPVRDAVPTAGVRAHLVYRAADNANGPWTCGTTGLSGVPGTPPPAGVDMLVTAEIALEADPQYYALNGSSVTATQNDITGVVNGVSTIYARDVLVAFTITQIVVTTSGSPYSTNDPGTLLSQFRNNWNATHTNIQRDVAHLFTGRNLSGSVIGIASLGQVCNRSSAYGLSQSRFSTNFTRRVGLTAHELGHSFGSQHCDSSSPCYIMCSGLGGCNNSLTQFGTFARNQITNFTNAVNCLSTQPTTPVIQSLNPTSVTTFRPGIVEINGTGLTGTTRVDLGATALTTGLQVVNDSLVRFSVPEGMPFSSYQVRATTGLGQSNIAQLTVTQTVPCKLDAPSAVIGGNVAHFDFGGRPSGQWFLVLGFGSATSPLQGFNVLVNPIVLSAGVLDPALGFGSFSIPVPAGLGTTLVVNTQLLEANATFGILTSVSSVAFTVLLP